VVEALDQQLQDYVAAVADYVDHLPGAGPDGSTLPGGVPAVPGPPPVVDDVGGTVDDVVGGVGDSVDDLLP